METSNSTKLPNDRKTMKEELADLVRRRLPSPAMQARAARQRISEVCEKRDAWRMSIPPQGDDSDILLGFIIDEYERLATEQSEDAPCADCGHPWESWNHAESNPNSHDPVGPSQQAYRDEYEFADASEAWSAAPLCQTPFNAFSAGFNMARQRK